jgi:hypothetical protein
MNKFHSVNDQFQKWGIDRAWGMDLHDWGIGIQVYFDIKWKDFSINIHIGPFWGNIGLWLSEYLKVCPQCGQSYLGVCKVCPDPYEDEEEEE